MAGLYQVTTADLLAEIAKRIDHAKDPTAEPDATNLETPKYWTGTRIFNGVEREVKSGADLSRTDLYGANLYGANLSGAHLYGADLSRADLSRADLSRANLYGADLSGANLYGADLSRADLSRANLSGAIGDSDTLLPDGYVVSPSGLIIREEVDTDAS